MNHVKQLAGQTAVYGMGIVLPRVLNYLLLTPFYTRIFSRAEYGMFTELYAYVVFLMVILTYGLETGLFRFADSRDNRDDVYKTTLVSIIVTSAIFIFVMLLSARRIASFIGYSGHVEYITLLGLIVGLDALSAIPFAKIRLDNHPRRYAIIRIVEVSVNLLANGFFLLWARHHYMDNAFAAKVYKPEIGIGYVLICNLIATAVKTLMLAKEIFYFKGRFYLALWRTIIAYCLPLLIAGLAGTVNETIDRVMIRHLIPEAQHPLEQLGVYGANYKLAVLMTLFIQMFRYAAEPFFFSKKNELDARTIYADVMKYFVFTCVVIFLMVVLYMDIFKYFIGSQFRTGLDIVPIVLIGNLLMGIFFNLSIWYKLQNLTRFGAYLVIIGAILTFVINYFYIPVYGYMASAWGHFVSYMVMVVLSYLLGRKYYRINYNLKNIGTVLIVGLGVYAFFKAVTFDSRILEYTLKTLSIIIIIAVFILNETGKLKMSKSKGGE